MSDHDANHDHEPDEAGRTPCEWPWHRDDPHAPDEPVCWVCDVRQALARLCADTGGDHHVLGRLARYPIGLIVRHLRPDLWIDPEIQTDTEPDTEPEERS